MDKATEEYLKLHKQIIEAIKQDPSRSFELINSVTAHCAEEINTLQEQVYRIAIALSMAYGYLFEMRNIRPIPAEQIKAMLTAMIESRQFLGTPFEQELKLKLEEIKNAGQ